MLCYTAMPCEPGPSYVRYTRISINVEDDHHDTSADADAHKAYGVVPRFVTLRSYGKLASGVFGCPRRRFSLLDACLGTT